MIIRSENQDDYTVLPNTLLQDDKISNKALGLLVRLLCMPENWNFTIDKIIIPNKTGQHSIKSAIKELGAHGYIHRFMIRKDGKTAGTEYFVFDKSTTRADAEAMFKEFMKNGRG